jgi:hypothetical protein
VKALLYNALQAGGSIRRFVASSSPCPKITRVVQASVTIAPLRSAIFVGPVRSDGVPANHGNPILTPEAEQFLLTDQSVQTLCIDHVDISRFEQYLYHGFSLLPFFHGFPDRVVNVFAAEWFPEQLVAAVCEVCQFTDR